MKMLARTINGLLAKTGFCIQRVVPPSAGGTFQSDGLTTQHNHEFMNDARFKAAYARGMKATGGNDYGIYWRAHIALWAARTAAKLPGDFVECGVNRGLLSSAIMHDVDWNRRDKTFYLLDTFEGLDPTTADAEQLRASKEHIDSGFYVKGVDSVRENFKEWQRVQIVVGAVPGTLERVTSDRIAYLSLDMNHATPEVAALEFFWPRLSSGAIVLMDDYAYCGYRDQKVALDQATARFGVSVAALPTGQGLLIKPPA